MRRYLWFYLLALVCLLLQSSFFPRFLPIDWRPDLMLVLFVLLGARERSAQTLIAALLLGAAQDSLSGTTVGLHICVYLIVLILIRLLAEKLNVDNSPLLILLILGGTALQSVVAGFMVALLADAPAVLWFLLTALPQQLLINLLAAFFLLLLPWPVPREVPTFRSGEVV